MKIHISKIKAKSLNKTPKKLIEEKKKEDKENQASLTEEIETVVKPKFIFNLKKQKQKETQDVKTSIELPDFVKDQIASKKAKQTLSNSGDDSGRISSESGQNNSPSRGSKVSPISFKIKSHEPEKLNKDQINLEHLNEQQKQTIDYGIKGISHCLIGAAGTGKTTTQRVLTQTLLEYGLIEPLQTSSKHFFINQPSILICSFTNKAVENIRSAVPDEFKKCCMTIHKAIEFSPVKCAEEDEEGNIIVKRKFMPLRHADNPLPKITYCIVEEASTIGTTLFSQLVDALPNNCTFIFLGDLNQLPPVMDDAILGFALNHLPIVELTEVYRQALESPIINFAYKILAGKGLRKKQIDELKESYNRDQLNFIHFEKWDPPELAMKKLGTIFKTLATTEKFSVEDSVILMPFNTGGHINVKNMNRYIAQGITEKTNNPIYEVIAGWEKYYYSIGDVVFANKSLYFINDIRLNPAYSGTPARPATDCIDRWGQAIPEKMNQNSNEILDLSIEDIFDNATKKLINSEDEERKTQASHIIELKPLTYDNWDEDERNTHVFATIQHAAEINEMTSGYALTVHKSQGSEWKNVYVILADQHSRMLNRELLYTAVTRAREKLTILYQPEGKKRNSANRAVSMECVLYKGIVNQEIPGSELDHKLKYFKNVEQITQLKLELQAKGEAKNQLNINDVPPKELVESIKNQLWFAHPMRKNIELFEKLNKGNNDDGFQSE